MAYPTQNVISNTLPGTGVFGFGQVQVFPVSGIFTVPAGVNNVRVRMWGGGGGSAGSGGGFTLRTIFNLAGLGVTNVAVTVGGGSTNAGGTSSFGTFCSATGGVNNGGAVGTGIGGDINTSGGSGVNTAAGGGVGSLWGNGGSAVSGGPGASGASGGGAHSTSFSGGAGLTGNGGFFNTTTTAATVLPSALSIPSIDFIGTGGGGGIRQSGANGGGGGIEGSGGFPGGGGGTGARGADGLVIVEY
jgi:hypothetical protein